MKQPDFIHLRVHTAYSLLEGAIKVDKLAALCAEMKMPAVAMTDSGNVYGAMSFAKACTGVGVQPILGTQLLIKTPDFNKDTFSDMAATYDKVVVLVQNQKGYQNLLELFTIYYMGADKQHTPHLTFDELLAKTEGLILLTGGVEGILGRPLLKDNKKQAALILEKLKEGFKGRLYMEIQRHGMEEEQQTEQGFLELAYEHHIPLVATNEVFFATPDMYEAHDALICIAEKTYVDETNRRRLTPEHYLKTPAQMKELFADIPEAVVNTVNIARRCAFLVGKQKTAFPNFDCQGKTEIELLREMSLDGLKKRMVGRPAEEMKEYEQRLLDELTIIDNMGFPGYFLIVADFIQWSKKNGVPVGPGRGSGAGSVVAWALTITDIDPPRFNLLFERFLNPERVSLPDFDVDFCQEGREKTIEYVQKKYGFDYVAQIITFGKLQAKAVIRDVGRVLQVPYPVVDRLSKLVPNTIGIKLTEAFEQEPEFQKEAARDENIKRLLEIAVKLEGLYRNSSTHAAGVVIGNKPLDQIIPIYKDPASEMPVTQFDMKFVEDASLVKFDFLGLKTLTVIKKALELLKKRNITLDIDNLPLDDEKTFHLLKDANSTGVFQLESSGMKKILRDMQPDKIEDIIALVSLYRPGPMDSIPSYVARKKGTEKPDYLHPMLEDILKETYGIMIYQEQVMQISQVMANYTLGGADLLRRAMGKKIKEEMEKQRAVFVEGSVKNNVDKETAEMVFDKMAKFAEYGFNKSHAAAYAYIAYQTAYLKAHYPVEFMAATMTLDKTNTEKLEFFKNDVLKMKIDVLPPDINKSDVDFSVEKGAIRYALSGVKNVGEAGMKTVVAEREKNGPFKSIEDFFQRVDASALNKRYVEHLVKAGAFDSIEKDRAKVFGNIENLIAYAAGCTQDRNSSQISLFGDKSMSSSFKLLPVAGWSQMEKLTYEAEGLGFYLSAHPLDSFTTVLERLRIASSSEVAGMVKLSGGVRIQLAGIVSSVRERISQKGNKFAFVTASDKAGVFDMMCFSDVLMANRDKLKSGQPVLLTVFADRKPDEEVHRMSLQSVDYLSEVMAGTASTLVIHTDCADGVGDIKKALSADAPGKSRVFIVAKTLGCSVEIALPQTYALMPAVIESLERSPHISELKQV
ncbi:MAG: DNA polymerase III subunit alpha [Lactobacillales bacterium]|jgi:DNA polymerase-3 subunit alpha|nr:DNA polymerase III subunit alpha [Lactobacillales bacterium]